MNDSIVFPFKQYQKQIWQLGSISCLGGKSLFRASLRAGARSPGAQL